MEIEILGQGFEPLSKKSVGNVLMEYFSNKDFNSFTGISAFATLSGVNGISKFITEANHLKNNLIVVGVNEKVTSKEALEEILKIENVKSYVFYANNNSIFHPKIYLFEGNHKSILIIGSSNLTGRGLFTNVETSIQVTIDNTIDKDKKVIEQLKEYFKGIFDQTDSNLKIITNELIDNLVKSGIVPTEAEQRESRAKSKKVASKETDDFISKIFPKRAIAKIPKEFSNKKRVNTIKVKVTSDKSERGELVWTRKKLPQSSVQLTPGGNPTGGLRLVQDNFVFNGEKIKQSKYFREEVFEKCKWIQVSAKPYVEMAEVEFEITIRNKYIGKFELQIRHKPSGDAGQGNYTTLISWGKIGNIIKEEKLTNCRLDLFKPKKNKSPFHIVIS
jgi:HKD family nuclease